MDFLISLEELREVLSYEKAELPNDVVHDTFHHYFNDILKTGNSSNGYVLSSANAILADRSLELIEKYKLNVEELYKAVVSNVDFSEDSSKIVTQINEWVKEKTNGKIEKLIDELSPDTLLAIMNAVYFKGIWKTQFDPNRTFKSYFYNNGLQSERKIVPMMQVTSEFPVVFTEDFKAWELPYKGENISMLILLPKNPDGLQAFEESMTPEKLAKIQEQMSLRKTSFALPKFKLEFKEELTRHLQALGVNRIFSAGADFSGMTPSKGVTVSQVLHKAVIEVNEEGSEAAAATVVVSKFKSGFRPFIINHPFLFAIVEKNSKKSMILFMGRVNNL